MQISVVIPIYNSDDCIEELTRRLTQALQPMKCTYEIMFVNDGSHDHSWIKIRALVKKNKHITGVNLTRNFGQHSAIAVGLSRANGHWIVVMDGDLQDNPKYIPALFRLARKGYDIVFTRKVSRPNNAFYMFFVRRYHQLLTLCTGTRSDIAIGNYCIFRRAILFKLLRFPALRNSFLQSLRRMAKRVGYLNVIHDTRYAGTSTYSFLTLTRLALVSMFVWVIPVRNQTKQSFAPMIKDLCTTQ